VQYLTSVVATVAAEREPLPPTSLQLLAEAVSALVTARGPAFTRSNATAPLVVADTAALLASAAALSAASMVVGAPARGYPTAALTLAVVNATAANAAFTVNLERPAEAGGSAVGVAAVTTARVTVPAGFVGAYAASLGASVPTSVALAATAHEVAPYTSATGAPTSSVVTVWVLNGTAVAGPPTAPASSRLQLALSVAPGAPVPAPGSSHQCMALPEGASVPTRAQCATVAGAGPADAVTCFCSQVATPLFLAVGATPSLLVQASGSRE
jgi:hypothetical protein